MLPTPFTIRGCDTDTRGRLMRSHYVDSGDVRLNGGQWNWQLVCLEREVGFAERFSGERCCGALPIFFSALRIATNHCGAETLLICMDRAVEYCAISSER